jgi:hypothetical protein
MNKEMSYNNLLHRTYQNQNQKENIEYNAFENNNRPNRIKKVDLLTVNSGFGYQGGNNNNVAKTVDDYKEYRNLVLKTEGDMEDRDSFLARIDYD